MLYWKGISVQRFMDEIRLTIQNRYTYYKFSIKLLHNDLRDTMSRWKHAHQIWFWKHDSSPATFLTWNVREFLNRQFPRDGPISWPPTSPDTLAMYSKCIYYYFQYKWNI